MCLFSTPPSLSLLTLHAAILVTDSCLPQQQTAYKVPDTHVQRVSLPRHWKKAIPTFALPISRTVIPQTILSA